MNRFVTVLGAVVLGCSPGYGVFAQGNAEAAATALIVGGKNEYAHLTEEQMSAAFGGYFAGYARRVSIDFPGSNDFTGSVEVGAANLYRDLYATYATDPDGFITIGGVSEGAPSVTAVLQRLAEDLENPPPGVTVPDPEHLNAAVYGYPSKALRGGTGFEPFPVTPYDLIFVFAEYDFIADFPDNPFNTLAVVNAVMGGVLLHVAGSEFPILSEPTEWVSTTNELGGTTTTIMIPAAVLPLLAPLQNAGVSPEAIARLDARLRPRIDRAYRRPAGMTLGVVPQDVVPWPPGYPAPAPTVATPMTATAASATVERAKVRASIATAPTSSPVPPATDVVTDQSARQASVVTAEEPAGVHHTGDEKTDLAGGSSEPAPAKDALAGSADGDEEQAENTAIDSTESSVDSPNGSADANTTGGKDASTADASPRSERSARAGSSAHRAATHSSARNFARHK